MIDDPTPRRRWPRSQRFGLSEKGIEAEASYRQDIIASRAEQGGRGSFDTARSAWARTFGVEVDDGLYLGELRADTKNLEQVVDALETCGKTRKDALAALERLFDAGLIVTATAV